MEESAEAVDPEVVEMTESEMQDMVVKDDIDAPAKEESLPATESEKVGSRTLKITKSEDDIFKYNQFPGSGTSSGCSGIDCY